MRVLLVYPRFPKTFWSYEAILAMVNRKVLLPPLGLVTVAALLPQEWEFKLVDRNIRPVTEDEWAWADLVMFSAMIVQQEDFLGQIREAKRREKRVVVGGPYPTSIPAPAEAAGADYLVLDEGETTIPLFIDALQKNGGSTDPGCQESTTFRADGEKPEVTNTPVPRFDLLDLDAYDMMSVQFSRGCPFLCEFCDIITLYGRRPRTKAPAQMLAELDCLFRLGWRRGVFMVDDNFIGNKRNVKSFLQELAPWQAEHGHPFRLNTEASLDLAQDTDLMNLMVQCNFDAVFVGVETPDEESLKRTKKFQNARRPLVESVNTITRAGLRVMGGFIIGFDGEQSGAGDRIVRFVEETAIPTVYFSMLQVLPHTGLWDRLEKEGRLRDRAGTMNQTTLTNFVPTRPLEELAREYIEAFSRFYEPGCYLDRTYRYFQMLSVSKDKPSIALPRSVGLRGWLKILRDQVLIARALFIICWRQGIRRQTRWKFWHHLFSMAKQNPRALDHYLIVCAHNEHFLEYRDVVREQIEGQLVESLAQEARYQDVRTSSPAVAVAG